MNSVPLNISWYTNGHGYFEYYSFVFHILFLFQLAYIIYRYYRRRSVQSMNFDNPVYKKTTTDDGFHLAGQQRSSGNNRGAQSQFHPRQYGVTSPEDVSRISSFLLFYLPEFTSTKKLLLIKLYFNVIAIR